MGTSAASSWRTRPEGGSWSSETTSTITSAPASGSPTATGCACGRTSSRTTAIRGSSSIRYRTATGSGGTLPAGIPTTWPTTPGTPGTAGSPTTTRHRLATSTASAGRTYLAAKIHFGRGGRSSIGYG